MNLRCPHCRNPYELVGDEKDTEVFCSSCNTTISVADLVSGAEDYTAAPESAPRILKRGERIGHFEILERCGEGGFGSVYRAFDLRLERTVAIKIPRVQKATSETQMEMFLREAKAAAQLSDNNVVSVYEFVRGEDFVYIVSDFVDGETLSQWAARTTPDALAIAQIVEQTARAVHRAHQRKIVHRDLKPSNILVKDGEPKITDFGLAWRDELSSIENSSSNGVLGTPAYMSPEQALGQADGFEPRVDIYACGVILYELLAGRRPYLGVDELLIDEICQGRPQPISNFVEGVDQRLEAICLKAMALDPEDRYESALLFAEALAEFQRPASPVLAPTFQLQPLSFLARNWFAIACCLLVLTWVAVLTDGLRNDSPLDLDLTVNLQDVSFSVYPKNAFVGVAKVDIDNNQIDRSVSNLLVRESNTDFTIKDASPGWYIIEAYIPDFGIQEVWRYVPKSDKDFKTKYRNSDWKLDENGVKVADIFIGEYEDADEAVGFLGPQKMVQVTGGVFEAGSDIGVDPGGTPRHPKYKKFQPSFWLAQTETTVAQYNLVIRQRPLHIDGMAADAVMDFPVTEIRFFEALEYAELIGARLITFDEYVFAATNGGTTLRPWGDDVNKQDFRFGEVGKVGRFDRTLGPVPIFNLCSGVQEWTQSFDIPRGLNTEENRSNPMLVGLLDSRIVVGGRSYKFENGADHRIKGPRLFANLPAGTPNAGVGIRCARSITPRILDASDLLARQKTRRQRSRRMMAAAFGN